MKLKKQLDAETNSSVVRKLRRRFTSCTFCPPHDCENRGRRVRDDKYKNKRRDRSVVGQLALN